VISSGTINARFLTFFNRFNKSTRTTITHHRRRTRPTISPVGIFYYYSYNRYKRLCSVSRSIRARYHDSHPATDTRDAVGIVISTPFRYRRGPPTSCSHCFARLRFVWCCNFSKTFDSPQRP